MLFNKYLIKHNEKNYVKYIEDLIILFLKERFFHFSKTQSNIKFKIG